MLGGSKSLHVPFTQGLPAQRVRQVRLDQPVRRVLQVRRVRRVQQGLPEMMAAVLAGLI